MKYSISCIKIIALNCFQLKIVHIAILPSKKRRMCGLSIVEEREKKNGNSQTDSDIHESCSDFELSHTQIHNSVLLFFSLFLTPFLPNEFSRFVFSLSLSDRYSRHFDASNCICNWCNNAHCYNFFSSLPSHT